MNIVVQKFGGTSVADVSKIISITDKIAGELSQHSKVVLVISAMAGVTNAFLSYCRQISLLVDQQDLQIADFVISNGENISSGLVALALRKKGIKAVALQGWQVPINTSDNPSESLITSIDSDKILQYLSQGFVPVISGFQGVDKSGNITTLGRGGSDITATAVAAALNAVRCDIYTDVSGVYTADPRLVSDAYKITEIDYDSMLEFSHSGAKVLHPRSVEIAKEFALNLRVISSFDNIAGTNIVKNNVMELSKIIGIAQNKNILLAKIHTSLKLNTILSKLVDADVHLQNAFIEDGKVVLIASIEQLNKVKNTLNLMIESASFASFEIKTDVSSINIVGMKLLNEQNLLAKILNSVSDFELMAFDVSHSKISLLVEERHSEDLVKILHRELISEK